MATIDTVGGRFDAALLDTQWTVALDILQRAASDANQVITTTPTQFNYRFSDPLGNLIVVGAVGTGFTYDAQKQVLTGTITDFVMTRIDPANPTGNYSSDLNGISVPVASFKAGNWGTDAIANADQTPIQYNNQNFRQAISDVDSGGGNDAISFTNLNLASIPAGPAIVDAGAGDDTITLPSQGISITATLGAGNDRVELQGKAISPTPDPIHRILDFSLGDQINLEPFDLVNGQPGRVWGLAVSNSNQVLIASAEPNGNNPRTHAILENAGTSGVVLSNNTVTIAPPPPPQTPVVFGTAGPDVLIGDASPNVLVGLAGDDVILGRQGNDVLIGGEGNDSIDGEQGNDQIFGQDGNDTIYGNLGDDVVLGDAGDDLIFGNEGNDSLFGGAGNDTVVGGAGNDFIESSSGFNFLVGDAGNDQIVGGTGIDVIQGGIGNDVINGGLGNDVLQGGDGDDEIRGAAGDDSIDGANGNDRLFGDEGNDTIYAGDGADIIRGGAGNDTMFGGAGSDFFSAGAGTDIIVGEAGGDSASFGTNDGFNFWTDFQDGQDNLVFEGDATASQPQIFATLDGTGTWIGFGNTQIILEGVSSTLIDTNDYVVSLPSVTSQPVAAIEPGDGDVV